eukprot:CAMPEP_0172569272 /NCGR_PEP_ID=MMETSP1067-20121228/122861_1 /TAXON_ID=265564 ORGANISM="Thalassiosira punctigera, Strain Tpunct2005C2" /NCGR_SAMPLE_ID=MMETSP1067 /ASSEMBLY_ACC=CAM_ASM_000444 /LENGTH=35 /DNA_ID= /DNA_START= /DNA_END= /DNA_ORIENTATION=
MDRRKVIHAPEPGPQFAAPAAPLARAILALSSADA